MPLLPAVGAGVESSVKGSSGKSLVFVNSHPVCLCVVLSLLRAVSRGWVAVGA